MRSTEEILLRLSDIRRDVILVEGQMQAKLKKAWNNRDIKFLLFLRREQEILRFSIGQILSEMMWISITSDNCLRRSSCLLL